MPVHTTTIIKWISHRRHLLLLLSLLGLFLINPFLADHQVVLQGLLALVLIGAVKAVSRTKARLVAALLLAIPALGSNCALAMGCQSLYLWWCASLFMIAFLFYTIIALLVHLVCARRISTDLIMGSACAYLLLGLAGNFVFTLLAVLQPDAFRGVTLNDLGTHPDSFLYFSYVTLTTLGYGDIVPVSSLARALSCLLAIAGQFYLAVLVARLVGLHMHGGDEANVSDEQTGNPSGGYDESISVKASE